MSPADPHPALLPLFSYHEATGHTPERLRTSAHTLDWANMPDPFRHYEGAPLADLPENPPLNSSLAGPLALSSLFFYSCSVSASKSAPSGSHYALRVNPSSGNLHPTEFHFACRGLPAWEDGCYHYRPSSHSAELRGRGDYLSGLSSAPLTVLLSSIFWREAWKYRCRAYRYVNLDIGHAMLALQFAAGALGWPSLARGFFADREVKTRFSLAPDEEPMLLVELRPPSERRPAPPREWFGGVPNVVSPGVIEYPLIRGMHAATLLDAPPPSDARAALTAFSHGDYASLSRRRRSALDFLPGGRSLSRAQLTSILEDLARPLTVDWPGPFITPYVFVHRAGDLDPGLYRARLAQLELVRSGDQRAVAAALSLGQDLAGNSSVTFSFIADLGRAASLCGNRAYRFVHHEAGALGQRLYLAAESFGLRGTGIGAFYDDHVHQWLGIDTAAGHVVYHFAIGDPVPDRRLAPPL